MGTKRFEIAKKHSMNNEESQCRPLPTFQRRPPSDTPIVTTSNTPTGSYETTPAISPEASAIFGDLEKNIDASKIQINETVPNNNILHSDNNTSNDNTQNIVSTSNILELNRTENSTTTLNESGVPDSQGKDKTQSTQRRVTSTLNVPGLTKSKLSPDGIISKEEAGSKLVIIMVGLPATGKSYITNKLSRYLNYSMYYCKVFNVGNTRRRYAKEHNIGDQDSNFFDPKNIEANSLRDKWALDTLDELLDYLLEGVGSVAIFDATNTTRARRKLLVDKIQSRNDQLNILFLESICTDESVVEANIRLKLFGPDYKGKDPEDSLLDFKQRLKNYLEAYETIEDDEDVQYLKMIDIGKKFVSYNIEGFLASQTVYYLLNFNLSYRQIWITRNGESEDNVDGKIGGDSSLTVRGEKYSKALYRFIDKQKRLLYKAELKQFAQNMNKNEDSGNHTITSYKRKNKKGPYFKDFFVWTSMRKRAIQTGKYFDINEYPLKEMKMLDEINAGSFEGLTYQKFEEAYPADFERRQRDKLRYRFPGIGGESYLDVINRLRTVIAEIERIEDNVLIITHHVVARTLLGYFMNLGFQDITELDMPLHCVYCLEPMPYGIRWSLYEYNEESDTFHKVPQSKLNVTRIKQMGLVHREKHFSLVPTAPSSRSSSMASVPSNHTTSSTPLPSSLRNQNSEIDFSIKLSHSPFLKKSESPSTGNNNIKDIPLRSNINPLRTINILESSRDGSSRLPVKIPNFPSTAFSLLNNENIVYTNNPPNNMTNISTTITPTIIYDNDNNNDNNNNNKDNHDDNTDIDKKLAQSPVSIISSLNSTSSKAEESQSTNDNVASKETLHNIEHLQDEFEQLKLSNSQMYEQL